MVHKDKLIQWLEHSHQQITRLVEKMDRNLEIYPGWTIREVLAHFTGWDAAVITTLKSHAAGQVPTLAAKSNHNVYNADSISKSQALSFEHIYQQWEQTHEQLKIAIHDLSPEKLEQDFLFPWGQIGNAEDLVIGLTTEHEDSHMKDIEKLLKKQGETSD